MRKVRIIVLTLFTLISLNAVAQLDFKPVRGNCLPDVTDVVDEVVDEVSASRSAVRKKLPTPNTEWNPEREYRQLVVLLEFADTTFSYADDPSAFYDNMFNTSGFNRRNGPGCVADYYRDQSEGRLNLKFDVYGPVKVTTKAQPYDKPTASTTNYGRDSFAEAMKKVIAEHPDIDFAVYDWNGDKKIEQVIFIYAGPSGNQGVSTYGYVWPNTSTFTTITTADGYKISNYTASGELWHSKNNCISCGIGTVCHEFTHSLGLPDIYPTTDTAGYSVCDEWDLMDGGNFTNYGWCPPNYTPVEKWLMGWLSFTDLDAPATITDLKPVAEGGEAYRIKHSEDEWLILENRQQRGWDAGAPGKGLVIYHVNFNKSAWSGNTVNNNASKRRFELVHADNMDFDAWDAIIPGNPYLNSQRMNSRILSTSPYPWTTDSTAFINDALTDTSVPAPQMNYANEQGEKLLNKPITNIRMDDEGFISFDFMGGDQTGMKEFRAESLGARDEVYDMMGRRIRNSQFSNSQFRIVRRPDGTVKKMF